MVRIFPAFLAVGLILVSPDPADPADPPPPAGERGATSGKLLWHGVPDALRRTSGALPFDLSPDGKHILYVQGDPWPRVMVLALATAPAGGPSDPIAIGGVEPFGERAPRFDFEGRSVFFTADSTPRRSEASSPFHQGPPPAPGARRSPGEPLRLAVVRAPLDGLPAQKLLPAVGAGEDESAVFLDLHPGGRTVLMGSFSGSSITDLATGEASLTVGELDLDEEGKPTGPPRPLSFRVSAGAFIRYSWDGTSIYHGEGPASDGPSPVLRYGRAAGSHEPAGLDRDETGWLAGDLEVRARLLPHPGSFGWDGFRLHLLSRAIDGPAIPFRPPETPEASLPLFPVMVRGSRVLLAGGFEDRRVLAVAPWDGGAFESLRREAARSPDPLVSEWRSLLPGFSAEEVRARGEDARAASLIGRIRSSQVLLPGQPVSSIRARWIRRSAAPGATGEVRIDVTEIATGEMRVEMTRPAPAGGAPPAREVLAFDGRKAWHTDAGGETTPLDRTAFLIRSASCSPLRLLIDPAGLGFPWLSFRHRGGTAGGGEGGAGRSVEGLEVRSPDGWHAELRVTVDDGRTLPARIESPLLLPEERMLRSASRTTRVVDLEDYRPVGGRLLPGRIRFDDGIDPFELVLEEAEINPSGAGGLFR